MIADILNSGFEGIPISYSPRTDDVIALTLLACFFLSSIALARGKKFLTQQVKDFVLHRERTSIFDSSTAADVRYLLVLVVQTCVLTGIVFFNYFYLRWQRLNEKIFLFRQGKDVSRKPEKGNGTVDLPHMVMNW